MTANPKKQSGFDARAHDREAQPEPSPGPLKNEPTPERARAERERRARGSSGAKGVEPSPWADEASDQGPSAGQRPPDDS